MAIMITESAARAIKETVKEHGMPEGSIWLRVGVKGGGCSGFSYMLDLTEEPKSENDEEMESNGIKILVDNKSLRAQELRTEADRLLPQLRGTRVIPLSGLTGAHVDKLMEAIMATDAIWNIRISTGRLNRWLGPVIDGTPPPAVSGRRVKIRYMTQPKARPPYFVLFGNSVDKIPESYKRYLVNGLRDTFGLIGVPIRLSMRAGSKNPYAPKKRWG